MTHWNREVCPVCRRLIAVTVNSGTMHAHTDKCGHACPMSGRQVA
jgi:hypothetical protein